MTNTNKKNNKRKLLGAVGMLTVSAAMLVSSTFAWFTMNKTVKATTMQVKAHAEAGLLINEVETFGDTWGDEATGNTTTAIQLRPASTKNLNDWWHANSKKVNNEAGYGSGAVDDTNTVKIGNDYYTDISGLTPETIAANAATPQAQTDIYYDDATFGTHSGAYDNGEGYYVKYTYYIKSSNQEDLTVSSGNFKATVTPTLIGGSGTSTDLDPALRVGVRINDGTHSYFKIFAPVSGHDTSNYITGSTTGTGYASYTYAEANTAVALNDGDLIIPDYNDNGIPVEVFLWFEGEDSHCQSQYIAEALDAYNIDITFTDTAL